MMESTSTFSLEGGITRVVLFPTTPTLTIPDLDASDYDDYGYEVDLDVGEASYSECRKIVDGNYIITHTLCYDSLVEETPFKESIMCYVERDGVVADVTLGSGKRIRLGWSSQYGYDMPLRLDSCEFNSGDNSAAYPLMRWRWSSIDKQTAFAEESSEI